jgi:hypothetical protein
MGQQIVKLQSAAGAALAMALTLATWSGVGVMAIGLASWCGALLAGSAYSSWVQHLLG